MAIKNVNVEDFLSCQKHARAHIYKNFKNHTYKCFEVPT